MNKLFVKLLSVFVALILTGCAQTSEFSKFMWGSSTKALEQARVNAAVKVYPHPVSKCYDEVIKAAEELKYHIFINNKPKATIVLMKIVGAVDTTRVGVFFTEIADGQTKIYISSQSSNAKRLVADKIFPKLDVSLGSSDNQTVTVINE